MTQYLMSVWHPDGDAYAPDNVDEIGADVDAFNRQITDAGQWIFGGGLQPAASASVARAEGDEMVVTDGPFVDTKDVMGGFWILEAKDLGEALELGRRAAKACHAPVEVRAFHDDPGEGE